MSLPESPLHLKLTHRPLASQIATSVLLSGHRKADAFEKDLSHGQIKVIAMIRRIPADFVRSPIPAAVPYCVKGGD